MVSYTLLRMQGPFLLNEILLTTQSLAKIEEESWSVIYGQFSWNTLRIRLNHQCSKHFQTYRKRGLLHVTLPIRGTIYTTPNNNTDTSFHR